MTNGFNLIRFLLSMILVGCLFDCYNDKRVYHPRLTLFLEKVKPITVFFDISRGIESATYEIDPASAKLFFSGDILRDSMIVSIKKLALKFDYRTDSGVFVMPDSIKVTGKQCQFIGEAIDETGYHLEDTLLVDLP